MTDQFLFAGGGTGGHLFPGIAVADALRREHPPARVAFVGTDREVERRILAETGYQHVALPLSPLGDLRWRPDRFLWRNFRAVALARKVIREHRPRAVIGLGGLASAPTIWAAQRARIPVVLLEQNAVPGRATCWLANLASVIGVAFADCLSHLPQGVPALVCGNPVRNEIARLASEPSTASDNRTILVLGGSQGADALNAAMIELVQQHRDRLANWTIVHQTGPRHAETVRTAYASAGLTHVVAEFFSDMAAQYRRADVVLSRAGATTLAELSCAAKPMVLVPYPHAADDHQQANADAFARHGAAEIVPQSPSPAETAARLWAALESLLNDPTARHRMGQAARTLSHPEAAERIVRLLHDAVRTAA